MSVLTESELRNALKKKSIREYSVPKGTIITPSAKQFMSEKAIKLIEVDDTLPTSLSSSLGKGEKEELSTFTPRYQCLNGGCLEHKPEHLTLLHGTTLVSKTHRRIVFQGKLETLIAEILRLQVKMAKRNKEELVKDLEGMLVFVREVLRVDQMDEALTEISILGMNSYDLQEMAHHPQVYFGISPIALHYQMGESAIELYALRTRSRELEIVSIQTYINEDGINQRPDLIEAINRISSCFLIIMYKHMTEKKVKK